MQKSKPSSKSIRYIDCAKPLVDQGQDEKKSDDRVQDMTRKHFSWPIFTALCLIGLVVYIAVAHLNIFFYLLFAFTFPSVYLAYHFLRADGTAFVKSGLAGLVVGFVIFLATALAFRMTPEGQAEAERNETYRAQEAQEMRVRAEERKSLCGNNDLNCQIVNQDTFGCPNKWSLDRVTTFIAQGDHQAATRAISSWCVWLKRGDVVYMDDYAPGVKQVHRKGSIQSLWVASEVVN